MSLVNWNVKWATPRASKRSPEILRRIHRHSPDVVCLTETDDELLSPGGYAISSQPDFGHALIKNRRKVMLWSRKPWGRVDDLGHQSLPPGRYVAGTTRTSIGGVTVIEICIPWSASRIKARLESDRKRPWEDHETYLVCLAGLLKGARDRPLIIAGDFNQRIGQRSNVPHKLRSALRDAMPGHLTIATSSLGHRGRRSIDHIALSHDLAVESLSVISNIDDARELSDHFGGAASLSIQS